MTSRGAKKALFSGFLQTQHFFQQLRATAAFRRVPLAYASYCYLYRRLVPQENFSIEVFGNRLFLDPQDLGMSRALLLAEGQWEPAETDVVRTLVADGMTFVDIGANIGYYTLLAAQLVGSQGRVVAFEPSPANFSVLERNIEANGYRNVRSVPKAVSDNSGVAEFEIDPASSGTHRLSISKTRRKSIPVQTVSLDDYFADSDMHIDFVKLDAEGAEPSIIAGMKEIIKDNPKLVLLTEFSPLMIRALGHSPESFLKDLSAPGFEIRPITANGPSRYPLSPDQASELASNSASVNLLCFRHEPTLQARSTNRD